MILEAVLLLLGAQLVDLAEPASAAEPIVAGTGLAIPSIDEAARQDEWLAPFTYSEHSMVAGQPAHADASVLALQPSLTGPQFSLAGYSPSPQVPHEPVIDGTTAVELASTEKLASTEELLARSVSVPTVGRGHLLRWLGRRDSSDYGLAYDRVMLAPIVTPTALGVPSVGLAWRYSRGASRPDRLEYLWARAGKGPAAESNLDLLDTVFRTELGTARAVLITEISMRSLDPERAPNTTGFGDMVVGGKSLLYDGKCTKLSSIFLTYLNTGPVDRGLGTGHVSLEPGILALHQWSERTYLHGAINYRIPISGTRGFAGDVLTTSCAVSTVWQDCDTYAWMPVLELQTHSFLFGSQTEPDGSVSRVNGTTAVDFVPGSRFSMSRSALGACEVGVAGGFRCSDSDWFDSRMMFDIRWLR